MQRRHGPAQANSKRPRTVTFNGHTRNRLPKGVRAQSNELLNRHLTAAAYLKWVLKNAAPVWGGTIATAGGQVFTGNPEGEFMAINDETGEVIWNFQTGTGSVGQPITYELDGEQFVAIAAGWGGAVPLWGGEAAERVKFLNQGGSVWVFKLAK